MLGKMYIFTETSVRSLPIDAGGSQITTPRPSTAAINLSLEELLKSLVDLNQSEIHTKLRQEFDAGYTIVSVQHDHAITVLAGHVAVSLITTMTIADDSPK